MKKGLRKLEVNVATPKDLDSVLAKEKRIMLVFHATWCRPCKVYEKMVDQYKTEFDVPLCKVDVDGARELAQEFGVMSVPYTVIVDAGRSLAKELPGIVEEETFDKLVKEYFGEPRGHDSQ